MKTFFRLFFKALRVVLGPVMLLWEVISRPAALKRTTAQQVAVDQQCKDLVLYQFKTCPFCLKVRQEMHRLSLPIARKDAQYDEKNRAALLQGSGLTKVPCLKIIDQSGKVQWMIDSGAIISYLRGRFANI
jgi:glutaredoxin